MGMSWAEHTDEIDAPIEVCFAAIVDYESFSRWQDAVDSVEVMSARPDGLGQDVKLFVDAKIRKIDYVLRYSYTRPTEIRWDFVEGNGMRDWTASTRSRSSAPTAPAPPTTSAPTPRCRCRA